MYKYLLNHYNLISELANYTLTLIIRYFLGVHFLNEGNQISRESYPNGYCIFAFDLTPDLSANDCTHWNLVKHGSIRLDVRYAEPLANTVNCIVYAEFDNILEVDLSRQAIVDVSG